MRLDHLLSKESTSLPIVSSFDGTVQGDSQLVHWLLVLGTSSSVGDSVLTAVAGPVIVVLCSVLRECTCTRPPGDLRVPDSPAAHALPVVGPGPARHRPFAARSGGTSRPLENCIASTSIFVLPSYKERTVDALASTTDEGRVWLR